jgi:hypothetical protein
MNQYLLSVYEGEGQGSGAPTTAEEMQVFMGRVIALEEEMDRAGARGDKLLPHTAHRPRSGSWKNGRR